MDYKNIPISKLIINPSNDRFQPVADEPQAIDMMLDQLGSEIYSLAKDICERGLSPKVLYVIPTKDGKYLVKDGNRRTTAIKLMQRPNLIGKLHPDIKRKFKQLNKKFKLNPIKTIRCYITNEEIADQWVKLEHTGKQNGVGVDEWDSEQKRRFDMNHGHKKDFIIQVVDFVKNSPSISRNTKELLINKVKLTNIERLLSDKDIKKKIGIRSEKGIVSSIINNEMLSTILSKIIEDFSADNFSVKDIYTKEDKNKYIKGIEEYLPKENQKDESSIWPIAKREAITPSTKDEVEKNTRKTNKKDPSHRKHLIPSDCSINIDNPRIYSIFNDELKKIDIKKYPNSVAVLLRVFVELSLDYFLENHNEILKSKNPNCLTAQKSDLDMISKISKVNKFLYDRNLIDKNIQKGITVLKNEDNPGSVDSFNNYVHSIRFTPIPENLLRVWDNIKDFMVILWGNMKPVETDK